MSDDRGLQSRALEPPEEGPAKWGVSSLFLGDMCISEMSLDLSPSVLCFEPYLISATGSNEVLPSSPVFSPSTFGGDLSKGPDLFGLVRCHSLAANAPKNEVESTVSITSA